MSHDCLCSFGAPHAKFGRLGYILPHAKFRVSILEKVRHMLSLRPSLYSRSCEQKIGQCVKNLVALQQFILAYWLVLKSFFKTLRFQPLPF